MGGNEDVYLKDGHTIVLFEEATDQYWLSNLDDFYRILYAKVGCGGSNAVGCMPYDNIKKNYPVFDISWSPKEQYLDITFILEDTVDTSNPDLYKLTSTLDGKDIKISK